MATFGTDNDEGLHISPRIDFDGMSNHWTADTIVSMSPVSNAGDTIDSKRKISDLTFSLYDPDNTIWNELGDGTGAFNKSISVVVSVGGDYQTVKRENGTSFEFVGTAGSDDFNIHQGEIVNVRRSKNLITIRSQNKLNKISTLNWQMPVAINASFLHDFYGSFAFYNKNKADSKSHWNDVLFPYVIFNKTEDSRGGDMYSHKVDFTGLTNALSNDFLGTGIYDTSGTGINDFLSSSFRFLDTPFHSIHPATKFKGTFLGTFIGSITTNDQARAFGYSDLSSAQAAQTLGTEYEIDRIRVESKIDLEDGAEGFFESQLINITGDPTGVVRHCLFGKMVSDFLDEDTDMGLSFEDSQKIVGLQVLEQTIDPNKPKVKSYIDDALQITSSIFFVSSNNQFEMVVYGPVDFTQTIDEIAGDEVISSSFSNDINDFKNKVTLEYNYTFEGNEFSSKITGTLDDWEVNNDRTLSLSSQWIKNPNQANNLVNHQLQRTLNTAPEISVELSMKSAGRDLSELFSLEDPNSFVGTKIVQVVEYRKDFFNSKNIELRCFDGESLYRQRGYARWTDGALVQTVTSASKSGWGNAALGDSNGVVNGINTVLYGTHFIWW